MFAVRNEHRTRPGSCAHNSVSSKKLSLGVLSVDVLSVNKDRNSAVATMSTVTRGDGWAEGRGRESGDRLGERSSPKGVVARGGAVER